MKNIIALFAPTVIPIAATTKSYVQTSWTGITCVNWAISKSWTSAVPLVTNNLIIGDANFTGVFQPAISASSTAKSLTTFNLNYLLSMPILLNVHSIIEYSFTMIDQTNTSISKI
ncbi:MAG: hypothetical protein ABI358_13585 [Ginsengibacter sp.]